MIAALVALLVLDQAPKTFQDLEIAKITAMHEVKNVRLETTVTTPADDDDKSHEIRVKRLVQGDRCRTTLLIDDEVQFETYCNPPDSWIVAPPQRKYEQVKQGPEKEPPFDPKEHLLKVSAGSFQFQFDADDLFLFGPAEHFVIKSIETVHEGVNTVRKVTATITAQKSGHVITLTQWFLPDSWIVKRFKVVGEGDDGPIEMKGEAVVIDFKPKAKDSDFILDKSTIAGYEKVTGELTLGGGDQAVARR